jgi:hypothetical protein
MAGIAAREIAVLTDKNMPRKSKKRVMVGAACGWLAAGGLNAVHALNDEARREVGLEQYLSILY